MARLMSPVEFLSEISVISFFCVSTVKGLKNNSSAIALVFPSDQF
jgi:hypothetical protein